MFVYIEDNRVFCFGACWRQFSPISLFAAVRHVDYKEAADELAGEFGITPTDYYHVEVPGRTNGRIQHFGPPASEEARPVIEVTMPEPLDHGEVEYYHRQLGGEDYEWLQRAWGLDRHAVSLYRIGRKKDWPPAWAIPVWGYEPGVDLLSIRFRRDDARVCQMGATLTGGQLAWISKRKYWGKSGRNALCPFGLWSLSLGGDRLMLVEGETTVLHLTAWGIPALTLTGGVRGHPPVWRAWMHRLGLEAFRWWVTTFDDDEPGRIATEEMVEYWPDRILPYVWPPGFGGDLMDLLIDQSFGMVTDTVERMVVFARQEERRPGRPKSFWRGWSRQITEDYWRS